MENETNIPENLPLLPVKDIVIFPSMVIPLFVGRASSVAAVDQALSGDRMVFFVTQKDSSVEEPRKEDLYTLGTVGQILRMLKQPNGEVKILIQGMSRAYLNAMERRDNGSIIAKVELIQKKMTKKDSTVAQAQMRSVKEQILRLVGMGKSVPPEFVELLESLNDPERLSDIISSNMGVSLEEAQALLEMLNPFERLKKISEYFNRELSIMEVQQKITSNAKGEIDKVQRDYFLREQLKAIRKELGEEDSYGSELEELAAKIDEAGMPEDVHAEAHKQLKRLSNLSDDSAEGSVIRTYLDWLLDLPWSKSSKESLNIKKASKILDEDHYGMEEVKERILDFLALRKLKKDLKSPILCLVGPPGVGKTSLGRSVARALNREFVRMSFGGMRDEAEIRGHRRTYIGAMPGKIIQSLKTAGANNPVMMLDEIDKLGADFRGDPASALLEVLDPVQNNSFTDHYLGVPFDLSHILFITTANYLDPIPSPLRDRMEIIRLAGYTEEEKLAIVKKYIIPRQVEESGLTDENITFEDEAIKLIISGYTRESGLRRLEQVVGTVCRKIGRAIVEKKGKSFNITAKNLSKYLGARDFQDEDELKTNEVGIVTGLAWTPVGGEVLFVECTKFQGKGGFIQTGMMGDVMKESTRAALTYVRSIAPKYGVDDKEFSEFDIHIHIPAGAIPKDGPSAGITMATAIMSVVTGRAVKKDLAMTGEITITGKVLPIGGLKEKLFAAKRLGVKTVIIPQKNAQEVKKMPKSITKSLKIIPVSMFDEVLEIALI
ncbi:MAG: endopeptidase La [Deferribacteraceae bacterium]|jgi:ATP-dependent Lon protease|nr:endopeptidase La [Deferribacteraceae bacterium]